MARTGYSPLELRPEFINKDAYTENLFYQLPTLSKGLPVQCPKSGASNFFSVGGQ